MSGIQVQGRNTLPEKQSEADIWGISNNMTSSRLSGLSVYDRFEGLLVGTAVADSIGLPSEGLSARRICARWGRKPLQQRLIVLPNRKAVGFCSDDTEHAWLTAQALLEAGDSTDGRIFAKCLAKRLRWWFLALPAGCGMATLKACFKLCLGVSPQKSGVCSAGNGAAMRAPVISAFWAYDFEQMLQVLGYSTRITHRDERVDKGALVIAMAMAVAFKKPADHAPVESFFKGVWPYIGQSELKDRLESAYQFLCESRSLQDYLRHIGIGDKGVSGYIDHTVPAVIYAWLRYYGDYEQAVTRVIEAGGDTDTVAALVGALVGAGVGVSGIPESWLGGLKEWPADLFFLKRMATALAVKQESGSAQVDIPKIFWPLMLLRNMCFWAVVMVHGFRRLLPPF